ncbi:UvrD-helicase domain-containing protein [Microbacterium sp.]|uniref:UvrD-helicase domain-containing protein n=1 Tax=Microbacterium sp. TaxID=51671 RepID=UPI003A8BDD37
MTISPDALAAALGQFPPTEEQAAVIGAPSAPALVVAGAGSGKTETMSGRVVWLVANGIVRRDQVLGLTFTRKAAGELSERITRRLHRLAEFEARGLLPGLEELHRRGALDVFGDLERAGAPDSARHAALDRLSGGAAPEPADADGLLHRPEVATYNSFADGIAREHAVRIGRDPAADVLTDSAAWLLMRRVVFTSEDPALESRGEALSSIIDGALQLARDAADHRVDLDELAAFPERFRAVTERPSENKRVTVYSAITAAAEKVGGLAVLVPLARQYAAAKRRLGVIDYADQIAGAIDAVAAHPAVGDDLRDRYRVILLDEYQDTSVLQTRLLADVFADAAVMAVGDPHQSIYGWRGASAGNLGDFARAFAPASEYRRFVLSTSWRNSRRVLRAAEAVAAPLSASAPVAVDSLRPRPGAPEGEVEVVVEADLDAEATRVAEWFTRVRARRTREGRATTGAILFRSKKHMTRFADALGQAGVPHRILGLGGLLTTPEVVDVVAALRVISDPRAGSALIRLLAGPRWAIGLADLAALARLGRRLSRHDAALQPLADAAHAVGEEASLIDALEFVLRQPADHGWLAEITPVGRTRLREAGAVLAGLRRSAGVPIPELVRLIERELRLDIELAANEARGPARTASDQLRAFVDELHGFLATDDSGSLPNLLAWLDRAERLDEFAPRTEPAEADVVQLLTIHGSKGLEWDAVAVVRMVEDELPSRLRDGQGWLAFGVLPYAFRGDRDWLAAFDWERAQTQQELKAALEAYGEGIRERHMQEERRLAYVAVTRARDHLLLTAAAWAGTASARRPGDFLRASARALELDVDLDQDPGENPYLDRVQTLVWPQDPLGARRTRVAAARAAVTAARGRAAVSPARDLRLLLAERAARESPPTERAPARIPASRFSDFTADYRSAVDAIVRPLPERPYRQTRLGTLFHAWVEERSGLAGGASSIDDALWERDDDPVTASADAGMDRLKANFLASEWADLQPLEVETEIDFTATDAFGDGRTHVVICKLDAVYRREDRGGRIEIVDWKTGRPPRGEAERAKRMTQLELYRRAYHVHRGVPLEAIDVTLYYVADDLVLRG